MCFIPKVLSDLKVNMFYLLKETQLEPIISVSNDNDYEQSSSLLQAVNVTNKSSNYDSSIHQ